MYLKEKNGLTIRNYITLVLLILAVLSAAVLSPRYSKPEAYRNTLKVLNEKRHQVELISASAAVASVAIAAVPDDATTPIADQIADLASYLMLIDGVILFQEFMLTTIGHYTFLLLIPLACLFMIWGLRHSGRVTVFGLKLLIFSFLLMMIIPVSTKMMMRVDETFDFAKIMENVQVDEEDVVDAEADRETVTGAGAAEKTEFVAADTLENTIAAEANESAQTDQNETGKNDTEKNAKAPGFWERIIASFSGSVEKLGAWATEKFNDFRSAVTSLIVSTCLIPLATLAVFSKLMNFFWGVQFWDDLMNERSLAASKLVKWGRNLRDR